MSDLLKDVIADAKAVKAVAYANAKAALEEAFAPSIQRMVSARLAEEEAEEEEMPEPPAEETPEDDLGGGEEMDFDMEEPEEDEMQEEGEDPDLELEALIRELEGEDEMMETEDEDMMEMEDEDEMMESLLRELGDEGYLDDGDDATPATMGTSLRREAEGEDEDEMIEALIRELQDEEMMGEEEDEEMAPVAESRKLRRKVNNLQKKLNEALKANAVLKSTLSELNLLNAKLMYATKVNRMSNLSESLQMKVLQAFDRASTTREVQLVYTTLAETLKRQSVKRTTLREGASKPTRAMVPRRNEFSFAPRWAQLAGISKNSK